MSKKRPTLDLYCRCGFAAHLTFKIATTPATIQRIASRLLDAGHRGEGHAVCDKGTAERVRRKEQYKNGVVYFE